MTTNEEREMAMYKARILESIFSNRENTVVFFADRARFITRLGEVELKGGYNENREFIPTGVEVFLESTEGVGLKVLSEREYYRRVEDESDKPGVHQIQENVHIPFDAKDHASFWYDQ